MPTRQCELSRDAPPPALRSSPWRPTLASGRQAPIGLWSTPATPSRVSARERPGELDVAAAGGHLRAEQRAIDPGAVAVRVLHRARPDVPADDAPCHDVARP